MTHRGVSLDRWVVFVVLLAAMVAGVRPAGAAPFLFSANPDDVTVTQIDFATGQSIVVMDASDGLTRPTELTIDPFGNLYVANVSSPDILKLSRDGQVSVFVSGQGMLEVAGLAFSPQGELFVAATTTSAVGVYKFDSNGSTLTLFAAVSSGMEDIAFDHDGNLYVASGVAFGNGLILKVDPEGSVSVFAAGLLNPRALAVDGLGHLYVANRVGEVVDRVDLSTGAVQLFADLSGSPGDPRGVTTDLDNNVYVLNDTGDIRKWNSDGIGGNVAFQSDSSFSEALAFSLTPIPIPAMLTVLVDIKPGSDPSSINPRSRGVIPVAILTTDTFDATTVDPTTVRFGSTRAAAAPAQSALEDVDGDADTDLILHFKTQDTGIACGDTSATLTGETFGGQAIEGSDAIMTVGCK